MKFFESLFAGNFNDNPDYFKLIQIFEIFFHFCTLVNDVTPTFEK